MHLCRGPVSALDAAYEAWEPMQQGSARKRASPTKEASDGRREGGGENELRAG